MPGRRRRGRETRRVLSLSSMTGFARAEGAAGGWSWAIEGRRPDRIKASRRTFEPPSPTFSVRPIGEYLLSGR